MTNKEGNSTPPMQPHRHVPPLPDGRRESYPAPRRDRKIPSVPPSKPRSKPRSAADEQMMAGMGLTSGASGGGGAGRNSRGDGCLTAFILMIVLSAGTVAAIGYAIGYALTA